MNVRNEIARLRAQGYTIEDTYIRVKDYIELDEFAALYEGLEYDRT